MQDMQTPNQAGQTGLRGSTIAMAIAIPAALMLVGAGCMSLGDRLGKDVAAPITVPLESLKQSKEELAAINAKQNEQNEQEAADLTIALIYDAENADPKAALAVGEIGCQDRIAYVKTHREAQTDSVLSDALTTLFAIRESTFAGMYNALWQSELKVDKILSRDAVTTEVWLKGKVVSGGACDDPRIKAQIEHVIKRFKPKYKVFLNGSEATYRCLGDMSGECK